jgi:vacuolar-type H+-ATPase subunit I/STV1
VARLFNRAWFLSLALALCVGTIVWAFWPASAESLYRQGAQLMASSNPSDWDTAWREYLKPLVDKYPDHPYQAEVTAFREQREAARRAAEFPSEAQRFVRQAEQLRSPGDYARARQTLERVLTVFRGVNSEKEWVQRAREELREINKSTTAPERWKPVRQALEQARTLRDTGDRNQAERIWSSLESLYRDDPSAQSILQQIKVDRGTH